MLRSLRKPQCSPSTLTFSFILECHVESTKSGQVRLPHIGQSGPTSFWYTAENKPDQIPSFRTWTVHLLKLKSRCLRSVFRSWSLHPRTVNLSAICYFVYIKIYVFVFSGDVACIQRWRCLNSAVTLLVFSGDVCVRMQIMSLICANARLALQLLPVSFVWDTFNVTIR